MKTVIRTFFTLAVLVLIYFLCDKFFSIDLTVFKQFARFWNIVKILIASICSYLVWSSTSGGNSATNNKVNTTVNTTGKTNSKVKSSRTSALFSYMLHGALWVGGISFVIGFVGPLIFMPENNIGPLVGIFFTGPLGFIFGLLVGGLYWWFKFGKSKSL